MSHTPYHHDETDTPKATRLRHKKRGSTYRFIGYGAIQTDTPLTDHAEVAIYQGEADGLRWVRPVSEFEDGRFEQIGTADAETDAELIVSLRRANDDMAVQIADLKAAARYVDLDRIADDKEWLEFVDAENRKAITWQAVARDLMRKSGAPEAEIEERLRLAYAGVAE